MIDISTMAQDVDEFQRKVLELDCTPKQLPPNRYRFKRDHMQEELEELDEAYKANDQAAQVDALVDLVYVAIGAILEMGVPPLEAFSVVHSKNMEKERGMTKRGMANDAVKPKDWTPPDHTVMLTALQLRAAVSPVYLMVTKLRQEKGADYNRGTVKRRDHFPLRNASYFQMCWVKMMRLRSFVESGQPPTHESFWAELRDLIVYSTFWAEDVLGMEDK